MHREGRSYAPSVVRIGVNVHHSVQKVSLDALVTQRLATSVSSQVQHSKSIMPPVILTMAVRCWLHADVASCVVAPWSERQLALEV